MLRLPYAINLLILIPVCWTMIRSADGGFASVFEGKIAASEGLRLIVWSMWVAILLSSLAGLAAPARMLPLLGVQVVYKALWLALFVVPLWRTGGWAAVPQGLTASFIFIVATWPFFIWRGLAAG